MNGFIRYFFFYGILPFAAFLILQSGLCSTAIDNPNKLTKSDLVQHIIGYLDIDTVLYQSSVSLILYLRLQSIILRYNQLKKV